MNTEQKIANCVAALEFMENVPDEQICHALADWREGRDYETSPACGSPACFGGWLPFIPHFAALGVISGHLGQPWLNGLPAPEISHKLFGNSNMFAGNQSSPLLSDKEEILNRLKNQINILRAR